jgi:signal transduction histidine kinase
VTNELKNPNKSEPAFTIECRVIHPDNSVHYLVLKGKIKLTTPTGQINLTGVCLDMTPHLLADEALKAAKDDAENASRTKSAFMAKVSHDLRSPLNGIIGFAELMYHGKVGPVSPDHKEYLGDILASSRQLLILINDVVDLAKVESGKMDFNPEPINMITLLNETRSIFKSLISIKQIQLKLEIDPALPKIIIDPARLKQVIYNYVSNALKCTPNGGQIIIRVRPDIQHHFRLEVEDTGIGIRKEDFNRLFVEFEQLDRDIARQYPSSGLGLALTKQIVEAQNGHVGVTSEFGKGSTFYAILPFTPTQE